MVRTMVIMQWLCAVNLMTCASEPVPDQPSNCGANVVTMGTLAKPKICHLRFNTGLVNRSSVTASEPGQYSATAGEMQRERAIVSSGVRVEKDSPQYQHYLMDEPDADAEENLERSLNLRHQAENLSDSVIQKFRLPPSVSGDVLIHLQTAIDPRTCLRLRPCNRTERYRSYNGSCNSFVVPTWGMADAPLVRVLLSAYDDGILTLRKAKDGKDLPNVRKLRTFLLPNKAIPDDLHALAIWQWGQLIAHDTSLVPDQSGVDGQGIMCCTPDGQPLEESLRSQACIPIALPEDDPFYSRHGQRCMSVVRSRNSHTSGCTMGAAEQITTVNHFLDASMVYGNQKDVADRLRTFQGGRLDIQTSNGRHFLPNSKNSTRDCITEFDNDTCYVAGDVRVNQVPQIASLQNAFLREHNHIADALSSLNPQWDDETVYQESRRIVSAQWQHITYKEYLPIILGKSFADGLQMLPTKTGHITTFNEHLNPGTLNSFASAAYRSFHGMVNSGLTLTDSDRCPVANLRLSDWMNRPSIVQREKNLDLLLVGMVSQEANKPGQFQTDELTNFLFRGNKQFGEDLVAIDILRNRDHGLPSYNDFRELCQLKRATTFSDFRDAIDEEHLAQLPQMYSSVDDVDLSVGGQLERVLPGALTGRTFQCIMGEQFHRWKFGDRFYYEFGNMPHSFTLAQVNQIKKTSLSRLLCDNGDDIHKMQRDVFRIVSDTNPVVNCSEIAAMDLTFWKA